MPISIQIEEGSGTAIATCSGVLRLSDAQLGAAQLWKTSGWTGRSAVWDFREAEFDLASSEVREIAQFILEHQPTPPPAKIAFVVQRDVDFGVARMFEVMREDPATSFRVFRDFAEAVRWAGSLESEAG